MAADLMAGRAWSAAEPGVVAEPQRFVTTRLAAKPTDLHAERYAARQYELRHGERFDQLYDRFGHTLAHHARRLKPSLSNAQAWDLVHDALMDCWRRFCIDPESIDSPRQWLFTVVRHNLYAELRRDRRMTTVDGTTLEELSAFGLVEAPVFTERAGTSEASELLAAAATRFPDGARYVYLLAAGYTIREIAAKYATTPKMVNYQIARMRRHVREDLIDHDGNYNRRAALVDQPTAGRRPVHGVANLIRDLPDKQREVLKLAVDGYRSTEIAATTGTKPGAVRTNLYLARSKLAEALQIRREDVLPYLRQLKAPAIAA